MPTQGLWGGSAWAGIPERAVSLIFFDENEVLNLGIGVGAFTCPMQAFSRGECKVACPPPPGLDGLLS